MTEISPVHPFQQIKAREVVYAYVLVTLMAMFTLRGLAQITGIDAQDSFWTPIGLRLSP